MVAKITREAVRAKLENGAEVALVEALPAKYYLEQHLPGALNLPHGKLKGTPESPTGRAGHRFENLCSLIRDCGGFRNQEPTD